MKQKPLIFLGATIVAILAAVLFFLPSNDEASRNGAADAGENSRADGAEPNSPRGDNLGPAVGGSDLDTDEVSYDGGAVLKPFDQSSSYILNDPNELFPDAAKLKEPGLPEAEYLEHLHLLLEEYLIVVKAGGYPTGTNLEITNALLGDNPRKTALLPQDHPRINSSGELVDSWGTPYFFHLNSLQSVDIRSAGPDLEMYSDDDVVSEHNSR